MLKSKKTGHLEVQSLLDALQGEYSRDVLVACMYVCIHAANRVSDSVWKSCIVTLGLVTK